MTTYILLVLGFIFLIIGTDLLVGGTSSIDRKFHVSDWITGIANTSSISAGIA